ncbi:MAG: SHOCT domain-containing protein [Turicibacter sp.]|nr:SHOCT domain-containing protein [Turicibacter sp.]
MRRRKQRQQRKQRPMRRAFKRGLFWGTIIFLLTHYRRLLDLILSFPLREIGSAFITGNGNQALWEFGGFIARIVYSRIFERYLYVAVTTTLLFWIFPFIMSQLKKGKDEDARFMEGFDPIPPEDEVELVEEKEPQAAKTEDVEPPIPAPISKTHSSRALIKTKLLLGSQHFASFELIETAGRFEFELDKRIFDQLREQETGTLLYTEVPKPYGLTQVFNNFIQDVPFSAPDPAIEEKLAETPVPIDPEVEFETAPSAAAIKLYEDKRVKELRILKALLDEGLINADDYDLKKRQILGL